MAQPSPLTKHAHDRATARAIPPGVIDIILAYGESRPSRDGTLKHGLSGSSMRKIRRVYGREIAKALTAFRDAYVVETEGGVITVAYSRQPLFH